MSRAMPDDALAIGGISGVHQGPLGPCSTSNEGRDSATGSRDQVGFCFLAAPRASVVSLNGLLGRVHPATRNVVAPVKTGEAGRPGREPNDALTGDIWGAGTCSKALPTFLNRQHPIKPWQALKAGTEGRGITQLPALAGYCLKGLR